MHPRLARFLQHHHDRHHGRFAYRDSGAHDRHFGRHGHRGFQGFQGFGSGPGQLFGGDSGRSGIAAGRKLTSADLQLLILSLLAENPHHGYEIIKSLGERSSGYYTPSPGMVYPALTWLEEIGHASVAPEGTRKRYSVTADGLAYLETHRASADTLLEQLAWIGQRMAQVRQAFDGSGEHDHGEDFDAPPVRAESDGGDAHGRQRRNRHGSRGEPDFILEIRLARRNLKAAMIKKFGAGADEQRRIAAILETAARAIRGQ